MTADVALSHHHVYLRVTVRGELDLAAGYQVLRQIVNALETDPSPILLDVGAACKLSYVDISELLTDMGKHHTAFVQKIAVLYQKNDKEDTADFLELYAGNRGFQIQTFLDEGVAQRWLDHVGEESP